MLRNDISEMIRRLEGLLDRLPEAAAKDLKQKIRHLRELLVDQRPARLAVVGRRGAGKSSLINACFGAKVAEVGHEKAKTGAATWRTLGTDTGSLELLDTRGFQEGSLPDEVDSAATPLESIQLALRTKCPDAILFLVKAKEADSAIDGDLGELIGILRAVKNAHGYPAPVIAVVTQCDELEPKRVGLHRPDDEDVRDYDEKLTRVTAIEDQLQSKLKESTELRDVLVTVIGVASYMSWKPDGSLRDDERWRIDELLEFLMNELPKEAKVELARLSQVASLQRTVSNTIVKLTATICAGLAATPIPVADIVPITSAQVSMVVGIGYIAGRELDVQAGKEFLVGLGANLGVAMALREIARGIAKIAFPGAGNFVSGAVAYAGTVAIGRAAQAYFIDGVSLADARAIFERSDVEDLGDEAPEEV